jgi:hypothetical protein
MGADQRSNELERRRLIAEFERHVGGIKAHQVYLADGCPMCGEHAFGCAYCAGVDELDPDKRNKCPIEGEHLHVICGTCKYGWLERTKKQQAEIDAGGIPESAASVLVARALALYDELPPQEGSYYANHIPGTVPEQHRVDQPCVLCKLRLLLEQVREEVKP